MLAFFPLLVFSPSISLIISDSLMNPLQLNRNSAELDRTDIALHAFIFCSKGNTNYFDNAS